MNLDLNRIAEKIQQSDFIKNFINELEKALENFNNKNELKGEKMEDIKFTPDEEFEFYEKKWDFLEKYFEKELTNTSKGEVFIVTDKFENDDELHRYKVTQYRNNIEHKCIAFEKDLPENIQLGDVVRKKDGRDTYDEYATKYVNSSLNKIKQDIINKRN